MVVKVHLYRPSSPSSGGVIDGEEVSIFVSLQLWDGVESFDANVGVMGTIGRDTVIRAPTERRLQAQWCD